MKIKTLYRTSINMDIFQIDIATSEARIGYMKRYSGKGSCDMDFKGVSDAEFDAVRATPKLNCFVVRCDNKVAALAYGGD